MEYVTDNVIPLFGNRYENILSNPLLESSPGKTDKHTQTSPAYPPDSEQITSLIRYSLQEHSFNGAAAYNCVVASLPHCPDKDDESGFINAMLMLRLSEDLPGKYMLIKHQDKSGCINAALARWHNVTIVEMPMHDARALFHHPGLKAPADPRLHATGTFDTIRLLEASFYIGYDESSLALIKDIESGAIKIDIFDHIE